MNKRPIPKFFWLKTGTLCWEADGTRAKLRNLFLIFKTPLPTTHENTLVSFPRPQEVLIINF